MLQFDSLKTGTAGGTLMVFALKLPFTDVAETIVLAAIGATVSYLVSYLLKVLFKDRKS